MSDPAAEHQVRIALRDDQKAEKFSEHIAELTAQIFAEPFVIAGDLIRAVKFSPYFMLPLSPSG